MDSLLNLPANVFNWVGFDGSKVKTSRFVDLTIYCSELGNSVNAIKRKMQPWEKDDIAFALWGVGNHGGGPSKKDLTDIKNELLPDVHTSGTVRHRCPLDRYGAPVRKRSCGDAGDDHDYQQTDHICIY